MMELHEENKLMRAALAYLSNPAAAEHMKAARNGFMMGDQTAKFNNATHMMAYANSTLEAIGSAAQPEGEAAPSVDIPFELRELLSQHADERNQGMAGPAMNAIYAWHQSKLAEALQDVVNAALEADEQRQRAEKAEAERDQARTSFGICSHSLAAANAALAGQPAAQELFELLGWPDRAAPPASAAPAKLMSVPQVADMLREKNLLTESGMKTFLNGDALRFHPGDIARIINAAFAAQQVPK